MVIENRHALSCVMCVILHKKPVQHLIQKIYNDTTLLAIHEASLIGHDWLGIFTVTMKMFHNTKSNNTLALPLKHINLAKVILPHVRVTFTLHGTHLCQSPM